MLWIDQISFCWSLYFLPQKAKAFPSAPDTRSLETPFINCTVKPKIFPPIACNGRNFRKVKKPETVVNVMVRSAMALAVNAN